MYRIIRSYERMIAVKAAFHDTDTDVLARVVARTSVSVSWNAGLRHRASSV